MRLMTFAHASQANSVGLEVVLGLKVLQLDGVQEFFLLFFSHFHELPALLLEVEGLICCFEKGVSGQNILN